MHSTGGGSGKEGCSIRGTVCEGCIGGMWLGDCKGGQYFHPTNPFRDFLLDITLNEFPS